MIIKIDDKNKEKVKELLHSHGIPYESSELDTLREAMIAYSNTGDSFAKIEWCDEDLRQALFEKGFATTEENIEIIKTHKLKKALSYSSIEDGWAFIYEEIRKQSDNLKNKEILL